MLTALLAAVQQHRQVHGSYS